MVDWTDIPDRNRGQKRPRYSANVAPIIPGQDDNRSAHLRNTFIDNVNQTRSDRAERAATVDNIDWAMSRPARWYKNRDNLRSVKNVLSSTPAVTTDQNETRSMYQMLMNQMKGGDRGARLIDTRGLPDNAIRYGSKLFYDPDKTDGILNSARRLTTDLLPFIPRKHTTPSPATLRVDEYNPFPKAGFAEEWYKDQFPISSAFSGIMNVASENLGPFGWLKKILPKRDRIPLERDLSWVPEGVGEWDYNKIPNMPFVEDMDIEDLSYTPETVWGPEGDLSIGMAGMEEYLPDLTGWNEEWGSDDLTAIDPDFTTTHQEPEIIEGGEPEIIEDDFVIKKAQFDLGNLGEGDEYSPNLDLNIMNIEDPELKQAAINAALQFDLAYRQSDPNKSDFNLEKLWDAYIEAIKAGAQ